MECSICTLDYVGQTSNSLNVRIDGHRSDIKKCKNKNVAFKCSNAFALNVLNCMIYIKSNFIR